MDRQLTATDGNVTVMVTLYGLTPEERIARERQIAAHRAKQLAPRRLTDDADNNRPRTTLGR